MNCYFWCLPESLCFLPHQNKTKRIKLPVKNGVEHAVIVIFFSQKFSYFSVNYLNEIKEDCQFSPKKLGFFEKSAKQKY